MLLICLEYLSHSCEIPPIHTALTSEENKQRLFLFECEVVFWEISESCDVYCVFLESNFIKEVEYFKVYLI